MIGDAEGWRHRYEPVRRCGTLAYHDERMSDALHHYECALQIASDHHDRAAIAKRLSNAGSALRRLGDYRKALQFLIKSLEMQRADGQGVSGLTLMNIADVYRNLDDPKQALRAASSDENAGVIAYEQPNGGVDLYGGVDLSGSKANLQWNMAIEPQGKSVRITLTKTTPGGYPASTDFQITLMCAVIDAAR